VAVVQIVTSYRYLRPLIGLRSGEILDATEKSLKVTVFSLIAPMILVATIRLDHPPFLLWLGLGFSWAALVWLAGIFFLEHPVKEEILRLASGSGKYFWQPRNVSRVDGAERPGSGRKLKVHLINPFHDYFGGSERRALELYRLLKGAA